MAARQYISEMIRLSGPGMKIMIMDKETVKLFDAALSFKKFSLGEERI